MGGTGRDDISMQFAFRDFRPCWIYTWVAVNPDSDSRGIKKPLFKDGYFSSSFQPYIFM